MICVLLFALALFVLRIFLVDALCWDLLVRVVYWICSLLLFDLHLRYVFVWFCLWDASS